MVKRIVCRLIKSTIHSLDGLKFVMRSEFSFRCEVVLAGIALIIASIFSRKIGDIIYLMTPLVLMMAFEVCNTAIEKTIDELGEGQIKPPFKIIKDCASAAVFIMLLWSLVTWVFYFWQG